MCKTARQKTFGKSQKHFVFKMSKSKQVPFQMFLFHAGHGEKAIISSEKMKISKLTIEWAHFGLDMAN